MSKMVENKANDKYRDGIFRYLFKEENNFIYLYEEFTGVKLSPDEIEFCDTDSIVLSKNLKNDISFVTKDNRLVILVEHQSTKNPNMALRMLIYYAELLHQYVKKNRLNIYGSTPIEFPKAELYIAYNGDKPWNHVDSDIKVGDITIHTRMIDIKYEQLSKKTKENPLSGYAYLVQQTQYYKNEQGFSQIQAIDKGIKDCKEQGYLPDYIDREEFLTMVTDIWTVEQQIVDEKRWAREDGHAEGRAEVAKSLKLSGMEVHEIARHSGLSEDEVMQLN